MASDVVTKAFEQTGRERYKRFFIVDVKQVLGALVLDYLLNYRGGLNVVRDGGKVQVEHRSFPGFAVGADRSSVSANDPVDDRQPKSSPLPCWLGRKERVKDALKCVAVHAVAVVAYGVVNVEAFLQIWRIGRTFHVYMDSVHAHVDQTSSVADCVR